MNDAYMRRPMDITLAKIYKRQQKTPGETHKERRLTALMVMSSIESFTRQLDSLMNHVTIDRGK